MPLLIFILEDVGEINKKRESIKAYASEQILRTLDQPLWCSYTIVEQLD